MELKAPKQEFSDSISFHEEESIFPFKVMKHDRTCKNEQGEDEVESEFKVVVGNAIISNKDFFTLEDAISYIDSKPWELIVNLFCYTLEMQNYEKSQS